MNPTRNQTKRPKIFSESNEFCTPLSLHCLLNPPSAGAHTEPGHQALSATSSLGYPGRCQCPHPSCLTCHPVMGQDGDLP